MGNPSGTDLNDAAWAIVESGVPDQRADARLQAVRLSSAHPLAAGSPPSAASG